MSPTIPNNSFILFHHLINQRTIKIGSFVRVNHPIYGMIIKEVIDIDESKTYWLKGLNDQSVTTKQMGPICIKMITGIVFYKILSEKNMHTLDF